MSNFVPYEVFLRGILLHYFNIKKNASERSRILVEFYGDHAPAERTCQKWLTRFKSGNYDLEDDKFEDEETETLRNEDSFAMKKQE